MTLFEYLSVSFSVVLSLAVVRILGGISDVFAQGRVYWVHAAWVIHQLLFLAFVWWNVWSYQVASWNFLTFLAVLAGVGLVYFQAASLVPNQPASIASWRVHFQAIRPQFFGAIISWTLLILLNTSYLLSVPLLHQSRLPHGAILLISIFGLSTKRHDVQAVLVSITLILWPFRIWLMLAPGALLSR